MPTIKVVTWKDIRKRVEELKSLAREQKKPIFTVVQTPRKGYAAVVEMDIPDIFIDYIDYMPRRRDSDGI